MVVTEGHEKLPKESYPKELKDYKDRWDLFWWKLRDFSTVSTAVVYFPNPIGQRNSPYIEFLTASKKPGFFWGSWWTPTEGFTFLCAIVKLDSIQQIWGDGEKSKGLIYIYTYIYIYICTQELGNPMMR